MKTVKATFRRNQVRYQEASFTFQAPDFAGKQTLERLAEDAASEMRWDLKWETKRKPSSEYTALHRIEEVACDMEDTSAFMSAEEAATLKPKERVMVLVGGLGDTEDEEGNECCLEYGSGEIVTVDRLDDYGGEQKLAITIYAENGVTNIFDATDYNGKYPFKRI